MGNLGCNIEHISSKWRYRYEWTETNRLKNSTVFLEPIQVGGRRRNRANPCIASRSYLANQNNVTKQITIIKWHDIVEQIEICGWMCSGWVDLQASTEKKEKGPDLEQVWCQSQTSPDRFEFQIIAETGLNHMGSGEFLSSDWCLKYWIHLQ